MSQVSAANETNDPTTVSEQPPTPEIRVLTGQPTDHELAAIVAVLAGARGGTPPAGPVEINQWGMLEDRLRYGVASWQVVTLLDRNKLRR